MKRNLFLYRLVTLLLVSLVFVTTHAADHGDGPGVSADPAADINDLYVWMSPDARQVYLVMTVMPDAGPGASFSNAVQYVFHTSSRPAYGEGTPFELDIICQFTAIGGLQCFAGDEFAGSMQQTSVSSVSGRMRAFAGLRNDLFFFNLTGYSATTRAVVAAAPGLTFDLAGCPALDAATATALVGQLGSEPGGAPAVDDFAERNVLALVVAIDKTILTQGGPIVGAWAGSYRR